MVESDVEPACFVRAHLLAQRWALGPALIEPGGQPTEHSVVALNHKASHWAHPGVVPHGVNRLLALAGLAHMAALLVCLARPETATQAAAICDAKGCIVHGDVGVARRPEEATSTRAARRQEGRGLRRGELCLELSG